jgi:hypothetical protein
LQSFTEIATGVEFNDGGIPIINILFPTLVWYWVKLIPIQRHNH